VQSVVTLTLNPSLDISTSVESVVPEHKLRCKPPSYEPGGGGLNVSRAIYKLGSHSIACYLAGGHTGQMLTELLVAEGIEKLPIPTEGRTRESFAVFEETSSQQYRFNMPGPVIREAECQQMIAALEGLSPSPDYLVVSGSLPPGIPPALFDQFGDLAGRIGARLVVDTSGPALLAALERGVFLIKPNIRELGLLIGRKIESDLDLIQVAKALVEAGRSQVIVVSLGAGGALLVSSDICLRYQAPTVPIESKVGAGDSMVAGLVLALARGESLVEAVRFGVAAGAAAVMTPGSMLCRRDDTERLYQQMVEIEAA
jgi:6-phosphofructokinase 2